MIVSEKLLHFIWQHQYFHKNGLITDDGDSLNIIYQGSYNKNQGPDFIEATIKINQIKLVGNIEIHIQSSDWKKHQHHTDAQYNNVILHIVWNNDGAVINKNGNTIPQLTISSLVPKLLLDRYVALMNADTVIPCASFLPSINSLIWDNWIERLTIERLEEKTETIIALLKETNLHWEEVLWWMLAHNFGLKLNADLFFQVAKTISTNILGKHKNSLLQIEALLFGQANLLDEVIVDEYYNTLQKEYLFLKKKYQLSEIHIQPILLRMRPYNFPTIRLAQLAKLIESSSHLFAQIKDTEDIKKVRSLFDIVASEYWNTHYVFDKSSNERPKYLGDTMIDNIIINTIIPILFAYSSYHNDEAIKERMLLWLNELAPEHNAITEKWESIGMINDSSFVSQGLLQINNSYCSAKRCLECAVGIKFVASLN